MGIDVTPAGHRGGRLRKGRGVRLGMRIAARLHRLRHDRAFGLDLLYLTTVGARSGQQRTVPLAWFKDDGPGWLVVGSVGGAAQHPSWLHNIAAHPDEIWVEVDGKRQRAAATTLPEEQRAARLAEIAAKAPRYAAYQEKTDRVIPVVRLVPVG
jgi:deazaflavin-dependent oxidoreductase (nitroreductase family)